MLSNRLNRIAGASRYTCDFTLNGLHDALMEIVASFPVYRTYISPGKVSAEDARFIDWAVSVAKRRSRAAETSIFDFIRNVLVTSIADTSNVHYKSLVTQFAMKFQQFTGPVMAKGMEDTSFYRYNRLLSLNEVGGDPRSFGMTLSAFHGATQDRVRHWPHTMLATSTHDGKRSEDVRARINVLSEMPATWRLSLRRWSRLNRSKKRTLDGGPAPSRNDEYLLYQTLLGAWPLEEMGDEQLAAFRARILQFMLKAVREAKLHTSWIKPDAAYEEALQGFVDALLASPGKNLFLTDFLLAQKRIAYFGMLNSLSQTLIKLTSPGLPDIYQGTELWDFSLVDPDNRRPVDYAQRRTMLEDLQALDTAPAGVLLTHLADLVERMEDGRIKLYLVWRTLQARLDHCRLFQSGDYQPLTMAGKAADEVCAFSRQYGNEAMLIVAPRLFARRAGEASAAPLDVSVWQDTQLEVPSQMVGGKCFNVLTGERCQPVSEGGKAWLPMQMLLARFPVALLHVQQ